MGRPLRATGFSDVIEPSWSEVKRWWGIFAGDGGAREVCTLPYRDFRVCSSLAEVIQAIKDLGKAGSVYMTLNPVPASLDKRTADRDILRREWLMIDLDPKRGRDESATDAEKNHASRLMATIAGDLSALGWPLPVMVDSGNGYYLMYKIALPNDQLSKVWIKGVLGALKARYEDDQTEVDETVYNAGRLCKIAGTWARKGPDTQDRPHRMSHLLFVPDVIETVSLDMLKSLVQPPEKEPTVRSKLTLRASDGPGPNAYCRAALAGECAAVALAPDGDRNNTLNTAAFKLGTLVHLGVFSREDVEAQLGHAARRAGLNDVEIRATIKSGLDAGILEPREIPEREGPRREPPKYVPDADTTESTGRSGRTYKFPLIVRGQDVEPKQVEWLWRDRIPFGFLTLMAGRTGVGKSFTTLDIAARQTVGGEIPDGNGECFDPASVLIISEDPHEYMLAPRLIEAGADMNRVSFMSWEAMAEFALSDTEMLDDVYHEALAPRLVVIDPPTNFLGQKDEHKNAEVRGVLMGVAIWSMRHRTATVMITHCNKGIKKDMAALDRVIGSIAWASTSRIAHIFSPHPDERGQGVFIPLKNNLGPLADGLAYRVTATSTFARVEWLGRVDFNADDAMAGEKKKPRGVVATEWLVERFRERREWPSEELKRDAAEAGISKNALWSPEVNALPIKKRKRADATGELHWWWIAVDGWPPEENDRESGSLGNLPPQVPF